MNYERFKQFFEDQFIPILRCQHGDQGEWEFYSRHYDDALVLMVTRHRDGTLFYATKTWAPHDIENLPPLLFNEELLAYLVVEAEALRRQVSDLIDEASL